MCPISPLSKANQTLISGVPRPQYSADAVISREELNASSKRIIDSTVNQANKKVKNNTFKNILKTLLVAGAVVILAPKARAKWFKDVDPGKFDKAKGLNQDYNGLFVRFADYVNEKQKVLVATVQDKGKAIAEKLNIDFKKAPRT